jgi:tRNA (guanine-N7-)-methyltransferase
LAISIDVPDMTQDAAMRDLRSYGRRRGRALSARQKALWQEVLPKVALPRQVDALLHPATLFAPPASDIWLEIGFGGGEHLLWQAARNPQIGFIGCEPFEDGVVKLLSAIDSERLGNIRVHADDGRPMLRSLPEGVIGRVFVLFPDPWPKKRQQKRRLLSGETIAQLARLLRPGGELRIATDIGEYAAAILLALTSDGRFRWTARGAQDWRVRPADWPQTRYEAKAIQAGRKCYFFGFQRIPD